MEAVLESLRSSVGDQEFLRLTRTALRLVQNLLNDPAQEKYKKIRAASKVRIKTIKKLLQTRQLFVAVNYKLHARTVSYFHYNMKGTLL